MGRRAAGAAFKIEDKPMSRISGKVAVILGAAGEGNMGQTIARRFAAEGARVIVAGRNERPLQELARDIEGLYRACDITRSGDVGALAQFALENAGSAGHRRELHRLGSHDQAARRARA